MPMDLAERNAISRFEHHQDAGTGARVDALAGTDPLPPEGSRVCEVGVCPNEDVPLHVLSVEEHRQRRWCLPGEQLDDVAPDAVLSDVEFTRVERGEAI